MQINKLVPAHLTYQPIKNLQIFQKDYDNHPEFASSLIDFDKCIIDLYNTRNERFKAFQEHIASEDEASVALKF